MDNYQDSRCLELEKALADESVAPTDLPFWFLKAITQDFSDSRLIASGGFGSVYKGALPNGMVAVKKLHNKIEIQEEDFRREIACLIKVKHKNIVRLLGYSYETQHMIYEHQGRLVLVDQRNMLFCFEYLSQGSLANYVTDASSGLEWRVRYQIIKGICEGVAHLHERGIIHRDLKPENILLDDTMVPKIADFGISRCFSGNQYKIITENIVGSRGYLPPEFLRSGTITLGTDIYSLGVIITEILTGNKECPNINLVLESWTNTFGTSWSNTPLEQVKLCTEIGIDCMHGDRSGRPDIQDIICRLNKTDISEQVVSVTPTLNAQLGRFYQYYRQAKQACKPMRITASSVAPELRPFWLSESALLDVHPLELCFCFKAKMDSHCSLGLINRTDCYFAYFIRPQFQAIYTVDQPVSYHLCPMSSLVLNVKMARQELPPLDMGMFEILMVNMKSKRDLEKLELSIGNDLQKIDDDLLKRVEELDGEVHAAVLKAVIYRPRDDDLKLSMELAFGAMAGLAPKLSELLMAEYVMEKGLKPNIESLSKELVMMKSSLENWSQVPSDQLSEVEKQWARQVRELSYDMEDDVDDFILRMAGGVKSAATTTDTEVFKKILGKATATMKKFKDQRQICDKVKDMKKLSNELAELHAKYTARGTGANLATSTGIDPHVLNHLVGIEKSRDEVISMLSIGTNEDDHESDQDLKIVSIVGVGGLGKTTLAKTVHDRLKKQFGCSAFISVGRTASLTRAFEKMLVDLDENYSQVDMSRWDEERFSNELHKFLQQRRYFIVVDDIWDVETWKAVRYALRDNNSGSRIIMTTHNVEVVTKVEKVYRLKPLSDGNSKKLFYRRIQSQEGESLDGVSCELSSKIIDKCDGIPLAIIAIASLLVETPCEDWSKVYDSIGFGNGDNTSKILSYCYYDLPSYLKPCMLHLSIFPEDSIVDMNRVIWMWIGEGFIHLETEEDSLFEIGVRYFKELVNRSMIQLTEEKYDRFTERFCIHDIVFDLIHKLSSIENFITISGSREQHASPDSLRNEKKTSMSHSDSKVRRLAVQNYHVQCLPQDTLYMPEVLRSLNIEDSKIENMPPLHRFTVCRVLLLQNCDVQISLKYIGRLLHLKYLNITCTAVDELPEEIGHLKFLQTLVLIDIELDELPPAMCSLTQLMCLTAMGFKRFPADRIGNLTSLEELQLHSVDGRSATEDLVVELGKLTRLRVVRICFLERLEESMQKALVQSLCILHELQELVLVSSGFSQQGATMWEDWEAPRQLQRLVIGHINFSRLPRWINRSCLPHLCFLYLKVVVVEVQDLDNLARLPELSYLELVGSCWPPGYTVGIGDFMNLRFCDVGTTLKFHMGAMPRLEELQFIVYAGHWCWQENDVALERFPTKDVIEGLDLGMNNLLSLEKVTILVDCSGATATEVQEVEAVVTRAVENHANRPTMKMDREWEGNILSDEKREELLQHDVERVFNVFEWKDEPDAWFISHLRRFQHVQKAVISINCFSASMCEVEKVEAAVRHAIEVHPNHPTIQLIRINTDYMGDMETHSIKGNFGVVRMKDLPDSWFIDELRLYRRLQEAIISIDCAGASMREVEKVEAACRHAAEVHLNHPTMQLIRTNTDKMVSSDHPDTEQGDDHDDSPDNLLCKLQLGN